MREHILGAFACDAAKYVGKFLGVPAEQVFARVVRQI